MTQQQIQLKIESFLKTADKRVLDSFPIPGGRMRLFAANADSYSCNYAVINQWLDADETIAAAEEEFAGREISPSRFFGAPDSLDLEQLRPVFMRHGYSIKVLDNRCIMACELPIVGDAQQRAAQLYWQQNDLTAEEKEFIGAHVDGAFALYHIQRELRHGCSKMLFAKQQDTISAGLLFTMQDDTVMLSDAYTDLDYDNVSLVKQMIAQAAQECAKQQGNLLFAGVKEEKAVEVYRQLGFQKIPLPPQWWAVKGCLPNWLQRKSGNKGE